MNVFFGAVADDDTGATDLAGMLAEQGMRPVLLIDPKAEADLQTLAPDCDAIVLGAGSRALPPFEAYDRTRQAIRLLRRLNPAVLQIKYCSTFDSTPAGNIGPSIDAAMDETGEEFTIALPALPVNGRTTYMGYHFVHRQLLSDSPMRHHPLTPMTNPNLVSHLASQTSRRVGLAAYTAVMGGAECLRSELARLRSGGVKIAIIDCISDQDLPVIAEAIRDLPLITGSSAPAIALPPVWSRSGAWRPCSSGPVLPSPDRPGNGVLIVAGSCSRATRAQNESFEQTGSASFVLDPVELASGAVPGGLAESACREIQAGRTCLLRTASNDDDVLRVHSWGAGHSFTEVEAGVRISSALAELASRIVDLARPAGLVVAGGETSGAICRRLGVTALRVGRNIEPGVPLCASLGGAPLRLVLKSGNFGSPDFYRKALAAIRGSQES